MKVVSFSHLSDRELSSEGERIVANERCATATLVSWLMEFDKRRLYLGLGYSSLFVYCREALHMGEGASYRRIEAARLARRFRVILEMVADGRITLTNLCLIGSHITEVNYSRLLEEITHKKKSEVEVIVARLRPKPDAQTLVRRVVAPTARASEARAAELMVASPIPSTSAPPSPTPRPVIAPLAPERFKLQITMSQDTHDTIRQLQNLMRHSIPSGDAAVIVERALQLLLQEVLRRKCGMRKRDLPALDPEQPEIGGHGRLLH